MKTNKGQRRVGRLLWSGFLMVLILGSLGWVYRSNWMTGSLEVELAQMGNIEHTVEVKAVFANEEFLIQAPASGKVELQGKDGQRFRRGETVALLHPEGAAPGIISNQRSVPVSASVSGLFFQEVDGLENMVTPQNLLVMDLGKVLEQKENTPTGNTVIQVGTPLGKMVNNLSPTEAFIELKPTPDLSVGKSMKFSIEGQVQNAKILRKSDNPEGVVVRFSQYIEGTANHRFQNICWISRPSVSGVVIPKSALWTKGEEQGVYVVLEGIIQFRKVKVLDENDTLICVENLPHGIPVVKNPRSGIEGLTSRVKIPS